MHGLVDGLSEGDTFDNTICQITCERISCAGSVHHSLDMWHIQGDDILVEEHDSVTAQGSDKFPIGEKYGFEVILGVRDDQGFLPIGRYVRDL